MKCLMCDNEFKQKHKYHHFCSKTCKFRNWHSKDRINTGKLFVVKKKPKSEFFSWKEYPFGIY